MADSIHEIGDLVADRYRIEAILGEGGCGTTYQALDQAQGTDVALKVLSFRQAHNWKSVELIEREAQVLARLDHPAIPRYLDYFQIDSADDRKFYLVQELAKGKSLSVLMASGWRSSESIVRRMAVQLLEILIYLHRQSPPVIHRDIKPDNIIRSPEGKLYLVDFGAVQNAYQSTYLHRSTVVGTFGYMAPEQFQGAAVPASDLYGLGATLLFLLTNQSPADLPVERLKIQFRDRLRLSDSFASWLETLLEPDSSNRFRSARVALTALQQNHCRQKLIAQKPPNPWPVLIGVGAIAVATITGVVINRYAVLNAFGITADIHETIHEGYLEVDDYLARGGDPRGRDRKGRTLLHFAVRRDDIELARMVLHKGVEVNARDRNGETPFHGVRSQQMIDFLIKNGADVNAQNAQGKTLLRYAAERNDIERVKLLLANGVNVNLQDAKGVSPLQAAKTEEIAVLLISSGADPKLLDHEDSTFLYQAIKKQWQQSLQLLADKGADFNVSNKEGLTPLYLATFKHPSSDMASSLVKWGAKFSEADLKAYQQERFHPLSLPIHELVAAGLDVNMKDVDGDTLLHRVILETFADQSLNALAVDKVRFLIAQGANVNARNNEKETPLFVLARLPRSHRLELAKFLIAAGADANARGSDGSSLRWAASQGDDDLMRLLISAGADIKREKSSELLYSAVYNGHSDVLKVLIESGIDVNIRTENGATPLHWLGDYPSKYMLAGAAEVIDILIAHGVDINAQTDRGESPLHALLQRRKESPKLIKLLLQKGADVNAKNNFGLPPLHLAKTAKVQEILIAAGARRHP